MTQPNLLELAKQGDAQAIAALMNHQLQPKSITAKVALTNGCLQVMLESTQIPDQQALVAFIRKGIIRLGVESIEMVKIYGQQAGEDFPAWSQEFELVAQVKSPSPTSGEKIKSQFSVDSHKPRTSRNSSSTNKNNFVLLNQRSRTHQANNAIVLFVVTGIFLVLSWGGLPFVFPLAVLTGCTGLYLWLTSEEYRQRQAESKRRAEELAARIRLEAEALAEAQRVKIEEEQQAYLLLLDPIRSPVKLLQTNTAQAALEEFRKVEARVNIGINYQDLPVILAQPKFTVQQFERSRDSKVSPYLTQLIAKIMLCYEISLLCFTKKTDFLLNQLSYYNGLQTHNSSLVPYAIPLESELGKIIKNELPDLSTVGFKELSQQGFYNLLTTNFSELYYEFDITIKAAWAKASDYSDQLQEILDVTQSTGR